MKQLIRICVYLFFSICSPTMVIAQVTDALIITPDGNVQVPAGNLDVKGNIATTGNVGVKGSIDITGNVNTNGKLFENGNALLPKGVIMMWYGEEKDVPKGWAICNGKNDTPDLSGRFIVGAGSNGENIYKPRDNGGTDSPTLTTDQMPSHSHDLEFPKGGRIMPSTTTPVFKRSGGGDNHLLYTASSADTEVKELRESINMKNSGNNAPFDNRPKYYALFYIMKL